MRISLILAFLFSLTIQAQILTLPDPIHRTNTMMKLDNGDDPNIEGSKYISENFAYASLTDNPDIIFGIKYDAYNDDMVVRGKDDTEFHLNKNENKLSVNFVNGKIYNLIAFIDKNNKYLKGFMENLTVQNQNVTLLKQSKIIVIESEVAKTGYHKEKPAKYKRIKDVYFIKVNDQNATIFPKNKKKLIGQFSNHKTEISEFIKTNNIKFSSEDDLMKLTTFINDVM